MVQSEGLWASDGQYFVAYVQWLRERLQAWVRGETSLVEPFSPAPPGTALWELGQRLGLDGVDGSVLLFAAALATEPSLGRLLVAAQGEGAAVATAGAWLRLGSLDDADFFWREVYRFSAGSPLRHYGLVELRGADDGGWLSQRLWVGNDVQALLRGERSLDERLLAYVQRASADGGLPLPCLAGEAVVRLRAVLRAHVAEEGDVFGRMGWGDVRSTQVLVGGPRGTGKSLLVRALCQQAGWALLVLDGERLSHAAPERVMEVVHGAVRQAALFQEPLLIEGGEALLGEGSAGAAGLRAALGSFRALVLVVAEHLSALAPAVVERSVLRVDLPAADQVASRDAWELASAFFNLQGLDMAYSAQRYPLSYRQVMMAGRMLRLQAIGSSGCSEDGGIAVDASDLAQAASMRGSVGVAGVARPVACRQASTDLLFSDLLSAQLGEICERHQRNYGHPALLAPPGPRAMCYVFHGVAGTGKRSAVEGIARRLSLNLIEVDSSALLGCQALGCLEKVFAQASGALDVLFVADGDALFDEGRWGAAGQAFMRLAQSYSGLVIVRTLQEVRPSGSNPGPLTWIHFPLPDVAQRVGIWRLALGQTVLPALHPDIDFLSRHYALSGGAIFASVALADTQAQCTGESLHMDRLIAAAEWVAKQVASP